MEEIADGLVHRKPINRIVSLDGNIGAGKTTLLAKIRKNFPNLLYVVDEPVDTWTALKDGEGKSLLEHFYEDKKRWAYTFQNAAILSRLRVLKDALAKAQPGQVILTERSVLTDRFVFAEMLKEKGDIDPLEWSLYQMWYDTFATDLPMAGILYVTTDVPTSSLRIKVRNRTGEAEIPDAYLQDLERQHEAWLASTKLPVQRISTEEDDVTQLIKIRDFITRV
jgi:deoxycitidine kinase/deoxyguanosine kinase